MIDETHNTLRLLKSAVLKKALYKMVSYHYCMKRGELRHDLCAITFLTDHVVMAPKYHGKIPVGNNRRGTKVICKTCEEANIGTLGLYARNDESLCAGSVLKSGV